MNGVTSSQVASSTPFDNDTNGFTAENVQEAIEEAKAQDNHSGWYNIPVGTIATIAENKQMTSWGSLVVDGVLINDGQLIEVA